MGKDVSCGMTKEPDSTWYVLGTSVLSILPCVKIIYFSSMMQILRWDWIKNQPKVPDSPGDSWNGRWYSNIASILKPPFLDTSLPAHKIAEWIDENTITIHYKLLPHIHEIRESKGGEYAYELPSENPYWQELLRQHAGSS